MDHTITVNGAAQSFVAGTLSVIDDLDGRGQISFEVESADGSSIPAQRARVIVLENGVALTGGTIEAPSRAGVGGVGLAPTRAKISAVDFSEILERKHVTGTIPAGNLKAALQWLQPFLTAYGLTLDAAQVNGPALPELPYEEDTLIADVIGDLETLSGYMLDISAALVYRMFQPGTEAAPFAINETDGNACGDIEVEVVDRDYANRLILKFMGSAGAAYAYLHVTANFADAETVVIGSKTYTFQAVLTEADGHVLLGASMHDSLQNLIAAITHGAGAGTLYAAATTAHTQVTAWLVGTDLLKVQASADGAAGNSIGVSDTAAHASWILDSGVSTTTLQFGYDAALTNRVQADDAAEQALHDVYEGIVIREDVKTTAVAEAFAAKYLSKAVLSSYKVVRYPTRRTGLRKGMTQTIVAAARGVNGTYLITTIELRYERPFRPIRYVTAIEGTSWPRTSYKDTYTTWNGGSSGNATSLTGGTISTGTSVATSAFLGGRRNASVEMAAPPAWTPILDWLPFISPVGFLGRVRLELGGRTAGAKVKARLVNITAGTNVESNEITVVTPKALVETELLVTIEAGKRYRLEVITDTAGDSPYAIAQLEPV